MRLILFIFIPLLVLNSCKDNKNQGLYDESTIGNVLALIHENYVDEVEDQQLIQGALEGMLSSLDRYSHYLPPAKYQNFLDLTEGKYSGIGLEIKLEKDGLVIQAILPHSPAAAAGLKVGDKITHLEDQRVSKLSYLEAWRLIQGPPGTMLKLTIEPKGRGPFVTAIKRSLLEAQPVKAQREGDLGYFRVLSFNEQTSAKMQEAIILLEKAGPLKGLILDLRNNPGGTLEQSVEFCNMFLTKGVIVKMRGRKNDRLHTFEADGKDVLKGIPMVIMINQGSASGAEIVAAALRYHKRGILIGTKTYGKGSAQVLFPLKGHGGLQMTVARIFAPGGEAIEGQGVHPDIVVEEKPNVKEDKQLKRAFELLKGLVVFSSQ